jgi:hypothetical protein
MLRTPMTVKAERLLRARPGRWHTVARSFIEGIAGDIHHA